MIKDLDKISYRMADDFESVNQMYIKEMGEHVRDIGKLTPNDLNILEQYRRMGISMDKVQKEMQRVLGKTEKEIYKLLRRNGLMDYESMAIFYKAKNKQQIPFLKNKRMQKMVREVGRLTNASFRNIANSTAMSREYQKAIDRGIYSVMNGLEDYNSAVKRVVKNSALNGNKVQYASGYSRRLDSAARMNILDGTRELTRGIRLLGGQEFGADGVEIDAHGMCAVDHQEIQGKQLTMEEFEEFQNDATHRAIGQWNCGHSADPIVLGVSQPVYSDDELQEMKDYSNEIIDINGKQLSRYDWEQSMRNLETKVREQKDLIVLGKASEINDIKRDADAKIKAYKKAYKEIADQTGITPRPYRFG